MRRKDDRGNDEGDERGERMRGEKDERGKNEGKR